MNITHFSFKDYRVGFNVKPIRFNRVNLLVGASGSGKSMAIRSLALLKNVADGELGNGVEWDVEFETTDNLRYRWEGAFDEIEPEQDPEFEDAEFEPPEAPIARERLHLNDEPIIEREGERLSVNRVKKRRLDDPLSIIHILKDHDVIAPAYNALARITLGNEAESRHGPAMSAPMNVENLARRFHSVENIVRSKEDVMVKLYLVYRQGDSAFWKIRDAMRKAFTRVADLRVVLRRPDRDIPFHAPVVQIRERGLERWIDESAMGAGVYSTLVHIALHRLSPPQSVILHEDLEKGVGANCLEPITELLKTNPNDHQYIVSSHHPFLVNLLGRERWRVTTREGGDVSCLPAEELATEDNPLRNYMHLLRLEEQRDGAGQTEAEGA